MRRLPLAMLVSVLLVGSLTGCQGKKPDPGDVAGYDEGEQYLSIWVHSIEDTDEGKCYRESVEAFNEKYNGTYYADIEFIPRNDSGGGYSDKINASVMSGDLPDVLTVDGPNIAAYASNGMIQPLAELTEEEKDVYLESIIEQGTYDGKFYALGAMESSVGLYYNKEILKEAGVEIPAAGHPWTHSEFLNILEKVKPVVEKKKGYALDMTFPVGETTIYFYAPFFWSNFKKLLDRGYMSKVPVESLFESGRAAFKFDGAWEVNNIYNNYPDLQLGVAPYVVGDSWDGGRYTPTGSWAYAASTGTENIEGATELVKWMSGVESGTKLWEKAKCFPSTYQAFETIDIFKTDENYRALYNQLSTYGHPRPKTPVYPQVSTSFQQVMENCVLTGEEPRNELNKAIERINAKLKRDKVNEG